MPTAVIVVFAVLVIGATTCVVKAHRLPTIARIVASTLLIPLGLFCTFGFIAAREAGDHHALWRVGYAVLFVACLAAIWRLTVARKQNGY